MHIAHVGFDHRNTASGNRVAECHTGMGVATGVKHDAVGPGHGFLDGVDQVTFNIGLMITQCCATFAGVSAEISDDVVKRPGAIDLGFTSAKHVEVRPVQETNLAHDQRLLATTHSTGTPKNDHNITFWDYRTLAFHPK